MIKHDTRRYIEIILINDQTIYIIINCGAMSHPNQILWFKSTRSEYVWIMATSGGDRYPQKLPFRIFSEWFNFGRTSPRERHVRSLTVSHHVSVVCPRSKLHETSLLVKREVFHVDFAKRFINGRWLPYDFSRIMQYGLRHYRHFVISISTT